MANNTSKESSANWGKRVVIGVSMQPAEKRKILAFCKKRKIKNISEFMRATALAKIQRSKG